MKFLIGMPGGAEWLAILFLFAWIVPFVLYILTLQNTLKAVSADNRKMNPANIWLLLIPLFGMLWHFIVVGNLADSIRSEADDRNIYIPEARPSYGLGLSMCIINCAMFLPILGGVQPLAFLFAGLFIGQRLLLTKSSF